MLKATSFGPVTRFDLARTIAGRSIYWTTCYAVDGLLIDTGCAFTARELVTAVAGMPLSGIFNTHSHEDHFGANAILQRERGISAQADALALPVLADPRGCQPLHPYRRVFWGYPEPAIAQVIERGAWVETEHYRFQTIYTPGHSPDHLCLYEPEQGWLFSGDVFVGGRERALRVDYDIWAIVDSLKKVAGLPLRWLFPAAARARENPAQELADKIAYLEETGEKVQTLYREGRPVDAIAHQLFGKRMFIEIVTLGHFTRQGLVRSFLGLHQKPADPAAVHGKL